VWFGEIKPVFGNNPENESTVHPVRVVSGFSFVQHAGTLLAVTKY
jgi:hypothetical protein